MGVFDYNAPQGDNFFAQGLNTGINAAGTKANIEQGAQRLEQDKVRTGLMSEEMKARLAENARRVGKEEATDRINLIGSTAMAAKLAEDEGADPQTVWAQAREAAIKRYPDMESALPKQYSKETGYALLGQSAEAMDFVSKMNERKEDRRTRKELAAMDIADRQESRSFQREDRNASRDIRMQELSTQKEINQMRLDAQKAALENRMSGGAGNSTYNAQRIKYIQNLQDQGIPLNPDQQAFIDSQFAQPRSVEQPQQQVNPDAQAAMDWLNANPDDPRAPAIREKLRRMNQ